MPVHRALATPFVLVTLLVPLLVGCAQDAGSARGEDPADPGAVPQEVPPADGLVTTRPPRTALVLGAGDDVVACLGPVAESFPPQCGGPGAIRVEGWAWDGPGGYEEAPVGSGPPVRFGEYALTARFDGSVLTVTDAVPAALHDTVVPREPALPRPERSYDAAGLARLQEEVAELPGFLTAQADADQVLVDVVHDDGSLQAWADDRYGAGVVVLTSALVPR